MPTRLRKVRRYRGSRQCGWGQVAQHRGSGSRGGFGQAGLMKHKWTWTVKYDPDHFGHDAFKPPQPKGPSRWLNVGQLDDLARRLQLGGKKGKQELNLTQLGYVKLLGEGHVKGTYMITVPSFSKSAQEKIVGAGGEIVSGSKK